MADKKLFDPGFLNCVTHSLSGKQVLYHLLHIWEMNPYQAVILWCHQGDAQAKANAVRVALSKERRDRGEFRTFELRFGSPWPYTYMGIRGEAIVIERINGGMQTRVYAAFAALKEQP